MDREQAVFQFGLPVVDVLSGFMFGMDIEFQAELPAGPKIFVPNHPTTTDPFLILKLTREQISILIDDRLFKIPVFGHYLAESGHIPVIPGRGREAFNEGLRRLQEGRNIAIFPEGQISPLAGGLHPARSGAARLAIMTGAAVIPVGIGLDRNKIKLIDTMIEGKNAVGTWYLNGPYGMTVGEAMYFGGDVEDREHVRRTSEYILRQIARLSHVSSIRMIQSEALPAVSAADALKA